MDSATAMLQILKTQSSLRVLQGIMADSVIYDGRVRDAFIATSAKESGLPSIRSSAALEKKIASLEKTQQRLRRLKGLRPFNVDTIIIAHLKQLRARAADLACNSLEIDRHRLEKSGRATLAADRKIRGSILSAMHDLRDTIQVLVPLSITPAVNKLVICPISDIHGPNDLPDRVGTTELEPEDARFQQLISAYLDLQGARTQLAIAKQSMRTAPAVAVAVSSR